MFTKRFDIFKLLGFQIRLDISWFFIAILIAWSLASGFFPHQYPSLEDPQIYWTMGIIGALGLFASVLLHELAHAVVARHYGSPINGITLFIFGGVAEMDEEPPSARSEFFIAVAGPVMSVLLGCLFYGVLMLVKNMEWTVAVGGVVFYLFIINFMLAVFNLIPAFPLDGGRMLRAILWARRDLRSATRITAGIGSFFGMLLIFLGILNLLNGVIIGGLWWCLIGLFLQQAAQSSYQGLLIRRALSGEKVSRFMEKEPVSVSPDLSLKDFVEDYVYKYHYKLFPVVDGLELLGSVTTRQVKEVPQDEWHRVKVQEIYQKSSEENTISPDADAMEAMKIMNRGEQSRLLVAEDGHLVGVIALKDLLKFLSLKIELEEGP